MRDQFNMWTFIPSWKPEEGNIDSCSWDGVQCNENTGRVIKVDLSSSCLQGSINSSSSLFTLVDLEWLDLSFNDFNGCKLLGQVMSYGKILNIFSDISLSSNRFDGEIPTSISNLKGLQILSLANNSLHGHIPSCLGNLTDLESLDLFDNYLSDKIPPELGLCGRPLSKQRETSEAPTNEDHMEASEE
ncbi:hypothetical protein CUMW_232950 [Citrus unshiu]|uniref:Leucine-rich repeat-containing N-terminal plant-type domain-containing protein n=1 Tax=Citrus unshiu TaxID=55188 RepID=A0A2H5QIE5_CITUN|nr:hypothetical protein CUMW_232950 [Citrus unshiu]